MGLDSGISVIVICSVDAVELAESATFLCSKALSNYGGPCMKFLGRR